MPEDIALMKELCLKSYRFSVSWTRVMPAGRGKVNEKGLDFYDRLVDNLLNAGIIPNVTLNHWDFLQALQDLGGWPNRIVFKNEFIYSQLLIVSYDVYLD